MRHASAKRLQRQHYLRMAAIFRDVQQDMQVEGGGNGWQFICLAIEFLDTKFHEHTQLKTAIAIIQERIAPYSTVEQWLGNNVPGVQRDAKNIPFVTIQDYRMRWLKSLAAEFANKGL